MRLQKVPCPVCGDLFKPYRDHDKRKQYCSPGCAITAMDAKSWSDAERAAVAARYPSEGPDELADELGVTVSAVQCIAYSMDVKLNDSVFAERVHDAARAYMLEHNPMFDPEVQEKCRQYWLKHPKLSRKILLKARQAHDRKSPSGLEKKLHGILDSLGVNYEVGCIIKPNFVVDVRIGNLIIEADGDYWHGHPSYEPLTERQEKQGRRDHARGKYLRACGYAVERIWGSDMSRSVVRSALVKHGVLSCTQGGTRSS